MQPRKLPILLGRLVVGQPGLYVRDDRALSAHDICEASQNALLASFQSLIAIASGESGNPLHRCSPMPHLGYRQCRVLCPTGATLAQVSLKNASHYPIAHIGSANDTTLDDPPKWQISSVICTKE